MSSGSLPIQEGRLPVDPNPLVRRDTLPDRYGLPLLELLIVDPYFVFISWEITSQQLEDAQQWLGRGFDGRRLMVALSDAESATLITQRELYGDIGRWFVELNSPGVWLSSRLYFTSETGDFDLIQAGPAFVPRDTPVEPQRWEELQVTYAQSEKGELRLVATEAQATETPPFADLPISLDVSVSALPGYATGSAGSSHLWPLLPKKKRKTYNG
jgi:hypothetical protein